MAMLTDSPPRKPNIKFFTDSDRLRNIPLPDDGRLVKIATAIEATMKTEETGDVRQVCADFLGAASDFYQVPRCDVRVLAARPLRVREHSTTELFGDYHPDTMQIRDPCLDEDSDPERHYILWYIPEHSLP